MKIGLVTLNNRLRFGLFFFSSCPDSAGDERGVLNPPMAGGKHEAQEMSTPTATTACMGHL